MKAAVIGHPVSHSLSPSIFRMIAGMEQSSLAYAVQEVLENDLASFLETLRTDDDFVGVNVTIPHKESVLPFLDILSEEVKAIGAANVIQVGRGKLIGHNTDVIGIRATFEEQNFKAVNQTCLLLGAGGAARAVAYVLGEQRAARVLVYNPRSARGSELCKDMGGRFPGVEFKSIESLKQIEPAHLALLVNCTPIGMKGEVSTFFDDLKAFRFSKNTLAFDLLYTPKNTIFLKIMGAVGASTVDGLGMLIHQALATWELWIGKLHHRSDLTKSLKTTLTGILKSREDHSPLYLTGFMGIGKSTIGRELAHALGRAFLDTDRLIEENEKLSIPEIFDQRGENAFRSQEREAIEIASLSSATVIALGGGALNEPDNLKLVLNRGTLIYLKASEATLFKRLRKKSQQRPLLAGLDEQDLKHKISELLLKRIPIYERAHLHVEVRMEDTPHETAQMVLKALGEAR